MKKLFFGLLFAACHCAMAQKIEEVLVTASPLNLTQDQLASSINLVDQDELQRSGASTLGEALSGQLGLASSSFGPGVGVPVIRGQSGKRVQIVNDGIRVADVSDTSADHAIAADIGQVRQVEVIRGPATLRYGAGAIGGVVNMVERLPGDSLEPGISGSLAALYRDNSDSATLDARLGYGVGPFAISASLIDRESGNVSIPGLANHEADDPDETTNGYIANTGAESRAYGAGLGFQGDALQWGVELKQLDNQYGVPPGAHGHEHDHDPLAPVDEPEEFVRIDLAQQDMQSYLRISEPLSFLHSVELELSLSDYEHTEIEIEDGIASAGTFFGKESREFSLEMVHPFARWLSYSGLSLTQDDFVAVGAEAFVPASETTNLGIYWVQQRDFSGALFEVGARVDRQKIESPGVGSIEDSSINLSGSLLLDLGEASRLGLILSRSERAPGAEELLSDGEHIATNTYEIGSPTLANESSNNIELTYRYQGAFSANASVFYNDFSSYLFEYDTELLFNHDLADLGATGLAACSEELAFADPEEAEEAVECFEYRSEGARFFGVEGEVLVPVTDKVALRVWSDQIRGRLDSLGDVPRLPPTRVGFTWSYESDQWYSSLAVIRASDQDRPGTNQETTEGYTRVDAYLGYRADRWNLFLRADNLTNREIRNSTSFLREIAPEPGRSVLLGARYHF